MILPNPFRHTRDSSVGTLTRLRSWQSMVLVPAGAGDSSLLQKFRPFVEPTERPIQWVPEANFLRLKQTECEDDHSHPPRVEIKNDWSCTSALHTWRAQGQHLSWRSQGHHLSWCAQGHHLSWRAQGHHLSWRAQGQQLSITCPSKFKDSKHI
jgi:hypothetical protein